MGVFQITFEVIRLEPDLSCLLELDRCGPPLTPIPRGYGVSPLRQAFAVARLLDGAVGYFEEMIRVHVEAMIRRKQAEYVAQVLRPWVDELVEVLECRRFFGRLTPWHGKRPGWLLADSLKDPRRN